MIINGIEFFDYVTPKLINPTIDLEIKNILQIFKAKKLSIFHKKDFIGHCIGYDIILLDDETIKGAAGHCDFTNSEIALNVNDKKANSNLFHEIGHSIQSKLGMFDINSTFSYNVKLEHQAEAISYKLFCELINPKINHKLFNTYFNVEDIKWLADYFNGYYEDDLEMERT